MSGDKTINLMPGDWFIVGDKYYMAKLPVAVKGAGVVFSGGLEDYFDLKTKADYEEWLSSSKVIAVMGRSKKVAL